MKTNKVTREQLLAPTVTNQHTDIPPMFIITYSRASPNFKELFSKYWSYLGRSSATGELGQQDFMITYRKPPSLKDMLVGVGIAQPTTTFIQGCKGQTLCKWCGKTIPQSGKVKNLSSNKTCNTITNGTCQSKSYILFGMQLVADQICNTK